jgi:hypothetical protein
MTQGAGMVAKTAKQTSTPDATLKRLGDVLVGTWDLSDGVTGQVTYEWMEGGFFLMQHVNFERLGQTHRGLEIIGRERAFGAMEPGEDIKSRYYDNMGYTFDYVYELQDETLTIWGGEKASPAYFRGTFSADGNVLKGAWVWPGGGYESTAVRVT